MQINKIMILGGGIMGLGIAQVLAGAGKAVVVRDLNDELIQGAKGRLESNQAKLVAKNKKTQAEMDAMLANVTYTTTLADAADCDLVIEAAVENLEIKKKIFGELDGICKPETIFASNTSSYSITAIASSTKRSERFIGLHFFNPATVMKLVEVVRGLNTADEPFKSAYDLMKEVGKTPIEAGEGPGFVVNRILVPMVNEGIFVLQEGLASAEDIDIGLQLGAGHPMGPLHLADLIGLDTCLAIMETFYAETGDTKYRPAPLLRKMVRSGKLGQKSGEGFFKY
ncbi:MAG: 3-hydroxybutyryl-CoA dehydrogenase [Firmicutes bacterium]|nr:3-hydroxybutyryl-CoA dehydrogenase [Bacillota bacterium]